MADSKKKSLGYTDLTFTPALDGLANGGTAVSAELNANGALSIRTMITIAGAGASLGNIDIYTISGRATGFSQDQTNRQPWDVVVGNGSTPTPKTRERDSFAEFYRFVVVNNSGGALIAGSKVEVDQIVIETL